MIQVFDFFVKCYSVVIVTAEFEFVVEVAVFDLVMDLPVEKMMEEQEKVDFAELAEVEVVELAEVEVVELAEVEVA